MAASVEPREDQMVHGEGKAEQLEGPPEGQGVTILSCWHRGQSGACNAVLWGTPDRAVCSAFLFSWGRDADRSSFEPQQPHAHTGCGQYQPKNT